VKNLLARISDRPARSRSGVYRVAPRLISNAYR
jgi:hypothetical protein